MTLVSDVLLTMRSDSTSDFSKDSLAILVAGWCEAVCYGIFFCMWIIAIYLDVASHHDSRRGRSMFVVSSIMMFLASVHVALNFKSMFDYFVTGVNNEQNPLQWNTMTRTMIFIVQEVLGAAVSIYRLFVIYSCKKRVIVLPSIFFVTATVFGFVSFSLYPKPKPSQTATSFDYMRLVFCVLVVLQNIVTTGSICYRLWSVHIRVSDHLPRGSKSPTMGVLRIFVESAALQLVAEILLLIVYLSLPFDDSPGVLNAPMQPLPALVGMAFCMIAIRVRLSNKDEEVTVGESMVPMSPVRFDSSGNSAMHPIQFDKHRSRETLGPEEAKEAHTQ